uniref:Ycf20 n=1 Tax=Avrainvillea mazei TaxID=381412 RepID=A0A1X9RPV3_9CHLO|nr:hypothetical protein [Avrainvillea mazei]
MRKSELNTKLNLFRLKTLKKNKKFLILLEKSLLSLYFGFFIGNFFGAFLTILRQFGLWDGISILIFILFAEFCNSIIYKTTKSNIFIKILKNIKIGLLIGFFIDAFKVGS